MFRENVETSTLRAGAPRATKAPIALNILGVSRIQIAATEDANQTELTTNAYVNPVTMETHAAAQLVAMG